MFTNGTIVKFIGNNEPCVVYRVIDRNEQILYSKELKEYCPHIKIEVLGLIPIKLLVSAKEHNKNKYAIDYKLQLTNQNN